MKIEAVLVFSSAFLHPSSFILHPSPGRAPMTSANSSSEPGVPSPTPEQHRIAAGQFDRANQVVATGNYDYGIHLLGECCKLDPGNLLYRQALRRAEKAKYRNNLRGSW